MFGNVCVSVPFAFDISPVKVFTVSVPSLVPATVVVLPSLLVPPAPVIDCLVTGCEDC